MFNFPEEPMVIAFIGGVPFAVGSMGPSDLPMPKVILTNRAKETAAQAYDDCDAGPRKSMHAAVEATAGIIAADNIESFKLGILGSIPMLEAMGRDGDAEMCRCIAGMMGDYVSSLDPKRPFRVGGDDD